MMRCTSAKAGKNIASSIPGLESPGYLTEDAEWVFHCTSEKKLALILDSVFPIFAI
jgi:hypothetical protein